MAAIYVVLVILGTILVTGLLKLIVDLPRPVVEDPILQYASSAMPSGHASNIAAAATAACVLSAIYLRSRERRRLVLLVGVLMALVVGLDRLMLGVHTLTEVAAGYALGIGVGLLSAYLFDRRCGERPRSSRNDHDGGLWPVVRARAIDLVLPRTGVKRAVIGRRWTDSQTLDRRSAEGWEAWPSAPTESDTAATTAPS